LIQYFQYFTPSQMDKFYTRPEIVAWCCYQIDWLKENFDLIVEPSAGAGAFTQPFIGTIYPVKAYDLEPEATHITKADFLQIPDNTLTSTYKNILTLGNPPFGRNCSLALQFLKKAMAYSSVVAFILPKSFKKVSQQNKIPLDFTLQSSVDVPNNAFLWQGQPYNVPCVFQIWRRTPTPRIKHPARTTSPYFTFVSPIQAQLTIRRVGAKAGYADIDTKKSKQSHYFIALAPQLQLTPQAFVDKCNTLVWTEENTTGPRSISKPELIEQIEALL
jgi:hypothetical protein